VYNTIGGSKEYVDSLVRNLKREGHFGSTSIDGKIKSKFMLDRGIIGFFVFKNVTVTMA
jgi:hypothetical protein